MSKICINTLLGIPATGKSTFCQKVQSETIRFNVIHICYDDFIQMPTAENSSAQKSIYFESKQYKRQRFSVMWLLQQLINDITDKTEFVKFKQVLASDFPHVDFQLKIDWAKDNFLLLIDDTMHYKSMRKEIRTLARNHETGYFVTYFHSSLEAAMFRNRGRHLPIDDHHLQRMSEIFEPPTDEDGELISLSIDDGSEITTESVELIAMKCIISPLKKSTANHTAMEQTILHKVDLILRRSINVRMKKSKETKESVDLSQLAKVLCAKRLFLLNELKMGRIDLPENLDDFSVFVE